MEVHYTLVFGYFFMCLAAGIFIIGAYFDVRSAVTKESESAISRLAAMMTFPALAVGILISMIHLGNLANALNVIRNLDSWMTREIWFAGFFGLVSFIYFIQWLRHKPSSTTATKGRFWVAVLGSVFAVLTVTASSMSYVVVTAIPAWNTMALLFVNYASSFALGVLTIALGAKIFKVKDLNIKNVKVVSFFAVLLVCITYAANIWHMNMVSTSSLVGDSYSTLLLIKVVVGMVLPLVLVVGLWLSKKLTAVTPILLVSLICIVSGDILSRIIMYITGVTPPLF